MEKNIKILEEEESVENENFVQVESQFLSSEEESFVNPFLDQAEKKKIELKNEKKKKANYFVQIPKSLLNFDLKPKIVSEKKIIFENAQNLDFYFRKLENPKIVVWYLIKIREKKNPLTYCYRRIFESAWKNNVQIQMMETYWFETVVDQQGFKQLYYKGKKIEKFPDCVISRMGALIDYFSLSLIKQMQCMNILILNSPSSLEISSDKLLTYQTLAENKIPIPKTYLVNFPVFRTLNQLTSVYLSDEHRKYLENNFKFPIIMKKSFGSKGNGIILIKTKEELSDMDGLADRKNPIILQEFIENSKGRDIRMIVIGFKCVGAMMRVSSGGFKSNFHKGGYVKNFQLTEELKNLAEKCAKILNLDIAGIDVLIDKENYKICEINSSPGFEGFELATGIDIAGKIIEFFIKKVENNKKNN